MNAPCLTSCTWYDRLCLQVLGPEITAYLVAALNPPGVCARGLSGVLLKAVQSPTPIPLFVAQRAEEVIKGAALACICSHCSF